MPFEFSTRDSASPATLNDSDSARPSVLIVEEDPGMRTLVERELLRRGFDVFLVSSAYEARQAMEALVFPIVVIDRVLGDADGIELIGELRMSYAHHRVYIVLFSSLDSAEEKTIGLKAGADAYVSKSAFPAALLQEFAKGLEVVRLNKR